jgi:hypothetical protein
MLLFMDDLFRNNFIVKFHLLDMHTIVACRRIEIGLHVKQILSVGVKATGHNGPRPNIALSRLKQSGLYAGW